MQFKDVAAASETRETPTAQQDASADMVRSVRAFHSNGVRMYITPQEAGFIADHVEELARLVDRTRQAVYLLVDRVRELEAQLRAEGPPSDPEIRH